MASNLSFAMYCDTGNTYVVAAKLEMIVPEIISSKYTFTVGDGLLNGINVYLRLWDIQSSDSSDYK